MLSWECSVRSQDKQGNILKKKKYLVPGFANTNYAAHKCVSKEVEFVVFATGLQPCLHNVKWN